LCGTIIADDCAGIGRLPGVGDGRLAGRMEAIGPRFAEHRPSNKRSGPIQLRRPALVWIS
jgi:hypothetical protein